MLSTHLDANRSEVCMSWPLSSHLKSSVYRRKNDPDHYRCVHLMGRCRAPNFRSHWISPPSFLAPDWFSGHLLITTPAAEKLTSQSSDSIRMKPSLQQWECPGTGGCSGVHRKSSPSAAPVSLLGHLHWLGQSGSLSLLLITCVKVWCCWCTDPGSNSRLQRSKVGCAEILSYLGKRSHHCWASGPPQAFRF